MAAGQLDNRAKLTIGIIAGLLLIGALHWLVFQKNQKILEDARRQYNEANSKVFSIRQGNQAELDKYDKGTKAFLETFTTLSQSLNVDSPVYLQMWDEAKDAEYFPKRASHLRDLVRTLLKKRDGKVRLPFLVVNYPAPLEVMGWQIPDTLPAQFEKQPARISDTLERLKDIRLVLEALSPDDVEAQRGRQAKLIEYRDELAKLGIYGDLLRYLSVQCQMGEFIPLINLIAYCDLIMNKKPKDYKITLTGAPGDKVSLEELIFTVPVVKQGATQEVEVLNVAYPFESAKMLVACKELEALNDLIDMAAKNDIPSILRVRFLDPWMYNGALINAADFYKPGSALTVDSLLSYFRLPSGLQMPKPATGQDSLLGALTGTPQEGAASPTPQAANIIGVIVPIDLTFVADNTHAVQYLYEIAHSPRMYEAHSLGFQINEYKPGEKFMAISAVVLAYAWVKDVSGVTRERRAKGETVAEAQETTGAAAAAAQKRSQ